jgi:hypothetical protein
MIFKTTTHQNQTNQTNQQNHIKSQFRHFTPTHQFHNSDILHFNKLIIIQSFKIQASFPKIN